VSTCRFPQPPTSSFYPSLRTEQHPLPVVRLPSKNHYTGSVPSSGIPQLVSGRHSPLRRMPTIAVDTNPVDNHNASDIGYPTSYIQHPISNMQPPLLQCQTQNSSLSLSRLWNFSERTRTAGGKHRPSSFGEAGGSVDNPRSRKNNPVCDVLREPA
jgi:hypothetical protein